MMNNSMMLTLNVPKPLVRKKPMNSTWQRWKTEFLIFLNASGGIEKTTVEKSYILQNLLGPVGIDALDKISFENPNDREDMDILLTKLDEYFDPLQDEMQARLQFFTRRFRKNEDMDHFVDALMDLSPSCQFGEEGQKMIRDQVICKLDKSIREIIFAKEDETDLFGILLHYKQIIEDQNMSYYQTFNDENEPTPPTPHTVTEQLESSEFCLKCGLFHVLKDCKFDYLTSVRKTSREETNSTNESIGLSRKPCWRCGIVHGLKECLAWKSVCEICKQRDHFTGRCKDQMKNNFQEKLTSNIETAHPLPNLDKCIWCGWNHDILSVCLHRTDCPGCCEYPHDVCHFCKKNPHSNSCDYPHKNLPRLSADKACSWCGTLHFRGACPHSQSCKSCDEYFNIHLDKCNTLLNENTNLSPSFHALNQNMHVAKQQLTTRIDPRNRSIPNLMDQENQDERLPFERKQFKRVGRPLRLNYMPVSQTMPENGQQHHRVRMNDETSRRDNHHFLSNIPPKPKTYEDGSLGTTCQVKRHTNDKHNVQSGGNVVMSHPGYSFTRDHKKESTTTTFSNRPIERKKYQEPKASETNNCVIF